MNPVVLDVSLSLSRGQIMGLVGETGCGKSTTGLAAVGYRGRRMHVTNGACAFHGMDLLRLDQRDLRRVWGRKIAYLPQGAGTALNPARPVGAQFDQVISQHTSLRKAEVRSRQLALIEAVGLPADESVLRRYVHQFSGGQQQRLAIAMALACEPSLIVLDEPTSGLDVTTQRRVTSLLLSMLRDSNLAALYISHDLSLISDIADDVAVMYAGRIVESGSAGSVLRNPLHPYTRALAAAVPSVKEARRLVGIPGRPPASAYPGSCSFAPRCTHAAPQCVEAEPGLLHVGNGRLCRCCRLDEVQQAVGRTAFSPAHHHAPAGARLLEVRGVWCGYRLGRRRSAPAVRGVSLHVGVGETVGIVGESGSGKSTLVRAIAGLHPPTSGDMAFQGVSLESVVTRRPREVCRAIQLVFQSPESSLNPRQTVSQLIGRPIQLFGTDGGSKSEIREEVGALLDAVKLPASLLHRYPSELSGGQKQRVALARAFAARPKLLLCDEVTSALDVSVQASILELISELSMRFGTSVIFVSHDLGVVRSVASRAIVMQAGEVCEVADTERLFVSPQHPYTRSLLDSTPAPID